MDSLERLSHSLEQAIALIHSLRRENRDLAKQAASALASAREDAGAEAERMTAELAAAHVEITRLNQRPEENPELLQRVQFAELEAARFAEDLEEAKKRHGAEKLALEQRLSQLELRLLAAEREETMPVAAHTAAEMLGLTERGRELEESLKAKEDELEKAKGAITAMQVKLAEYAGPDDVGRWQEKIAGLERDLQKMSEMAGSLERFEAEKAEMRKQKKALAGIQKERDMVRARLDEIHTTLENLRLS
jgi:hypothetical protein